VQKALLSFISLFCLFPLHTAAMIIGEWDVVIITEFRSDHNAQPQQIFTPALGRAVAEVHRSSFMDFGSLTVTATVDDNPLFAEDGTLLATADTTARYAFGSTYSQKPIKKDRSKIHIGNTTSTGFTPVNSPGIDYMTTHCSNAVRYSPDFTDDICGYGFFHGFIAYLTTTPFDIADSNEVRDLYGVNISPSLGDHGELVLDERLGGGVNAQVDLTDNNIGIFDIQLLFVAEGEGQKLLDRVNGIPAPTTLGLLIIGCLCFFKRTR